MPRYLISFDDGSMSISDDELPAVADAAHDVLRAAKAAGVWVTGGGLLRQRAIYVDVDGDSVCADSQSFFHRTYLHLVVWIGAKAGDTREVNN